VTVTAREATETDADEVVRLAAAMYRDLGFDDKGPAALRQRGS